MPRGRAPTSYRSRLLDELTVLHSRYDAVLANSRVVNIDPNRGGLGDIVFLGFARWAWTPSEADAEATLMALLNAVRSWGSRFRLLFPSPTDAVSRRLDADLSLLERWLERPIGDKDVPADTTQAHQRVSEVIADLRELAELLPADDPHQVRLVVDTNTLLDNPDLAAYVPILGPAYLVHVPPVVFSEIDDLKRGGRNQDQREAAKAADRRLKGLRDNGDVYAGARVSGQVWVIFEYVEPRPDGLPAWLDLTVPDDRVAASCLHLQSAHPGAVFYVATGDLNLQNKLAALGLPFIELP